MASKEDSSTVTGLSGMRGFSLIWVGQFVSFLGSGMTNFAMSYWLFEQTGRATTLTIAMFMFIAPSVLLSPVAGALVDRLNRKALIILTDLSAGLVTLIWLLILATGELELWQIFLGNFVAGAFNSLQFPAFSAAVSMMIPKEHFGRASGMMNLADAASGILAPAFAAALLGPIGLVGIMMIDVVSFSFAVLAVMLVPIPQPAPTAAETAERGSLLQDSLFGFRYIRARPSLLGLQLVFLFTNFLSTFGLGVSVPMILARTGNNEAVLGTVQSIGAIGGVVGGLVISAWGGPRRRVNGVLGGMFFEGLIGSVLMGVGRGVVGWASASFLGQLAFPAINSSNQAIWQSKVPPALQGRVFSIRRMIAQISFPVALLMAGPLADDVFEPAMAEGGALAGTFGWLVGTGPGAGMGLMLVFSGLLGAGVAVVAYLTPAVRNAETILPDFDAAAVDDSISKSVSAMS